MGSVISGRSYVPTGILSNACPNGRLIDAATIQRPDR
jgi:hypothetical protein